MAEQKKILIHLHKTLSAVEMDQLKELVIKILEEKFGLTVKIYEDYPDLVCVIGGIEAKEATPEYEHPGDATLRHVIVSCDYWISKKISEEQLSPQATSGRHGGA